LPQTKTYQPCALLLSLQTLHAQSPEKWEYCQITYQTGGFNTKTTVAVDYGARVVKALGKAEVLRDSTGSDVFKSPIDALNFLGGQGWECFSTYQSVDIGRFQICLFKRRM